MKMRVKMNSENLPAELDVFISLLGEIDMLKGQLGMLDKNTHIALSHNETSALLGNGECFRILKLIEKTNADISNLNASLLNAAELITNQCGGKVTRYDDPTDEEKKTEVENEYDNITETAQLNAIADSIRKAKETREKTQPEAKKDPNTPKTQNTTINNMLEYFKERFDGNE